MIWNLNGIVKGFYTGDAMVMVQFINQPMQPWLKRSGSLLYLGVGDGLLTRVA